MATMQAQKKLRIKPVDLHEARLIAGATRFKVHKPTHATSPGVRRCVSYVEDLSHARRIVEAPNKDEERVLVYGYDGAAEDQGGKPIAVLLTKSNLEIFDHLRQQGVI